MLRARPGRWQISVEYGVYDTAALPLLLTWSHICIGLLVKINCGKDEGLFTHAQSHSEETKYM